MPRQKYIDLAINLLDPDGKRSQTERAAAIQLLGYALDEEVAKYRRVVQMAAFYDGTNYGWFEFDSKFGVQTDGHICVYIGDEARKVLDPAYVPKTRARVQITEVKDFMERENAFLLAYG